MNPNEPVNPGKKGQPSPDGGRTRPTGNPVIDHGKEKTPAAEPGAGSDAPPRESVDDDAITRGASEGINPQSPDTMPRAEDDQETFDKSPEFHDRPEGIPAPRGREVKR